MSDEPLIPAEPPQRKPKKCPSCGEEVKFLQLSTFPMPAEQVTIPWLRLVNKHAGWSVRTFGQTDMNELQFLCFTYPCEACGLISWWDVAVDELERMLSDPDQRPYIRFTNSPTALEHLISKLPEHVRKPFEDLLNSITPKKS